MKKALIAIAVAAYASTATAYIENSAHDLSVGYDPGTGLVAANFSSCQFCHAPHYGNTTGNYGAIPLWNRNTPDTTTYSLYTAVSSSVSLGAGSYTCLSCHDGSSDMGASFSGSNGFQTSPTTMADNMRNLAGTSSGGGVYVANNANVDLRDDHPVGVTYSTSSDFKSAASVIAAPNALKLYEYTPGVYQVECGSCHEPHTQNAHFLRAAQNTICSKCHNK